MTAQQQFAIENACRLASETAQVKYASWIPGGSVVLTVNSGYE